MCLINEQNCIICPTTQRRNTYLSFLKIKIRNDVQENMLSFKRKDVNQTCRTKISESTGMCGSRFSNMNG